MNNISKWFFAAGALCALIGMAWGIQMSASHNHTLSPAHAHLNLVGFVAMSIFGIYYALSPVAAKSKMALLHFALSLGGVVTMVPGIALTISGGGEILAILGSFATILSMAVFTYMILIHGVPAEHKSNV